MHSLTSALDGGEWSASCPDHFTPRERAPGTPSLGGWVGPRAMNHEFFVMIIHLAASLKSCFVSLYLKVMCLV
jgi:hypothetical protein